MHLKRLELLGFKSFASKTVLDLERGITALVGPNGSGKSNVVDAVRWALGEQSLRAVRSRKSEEVIFAGNARRPAVGMAEVTLVLDNSDETLPLPFAEVSITRRQYRSGEGEYLINRARARLRDVVELLSRVGLGPDCYAVVGQGAVDQVLLQRPEERRGLLESAADVSRHQLKLRESLNRLVETEGNLRRLEDIRGEIAPRLSKLRTQANRARRHEELSARLREMLLWRYLLQIRHARERAAADLELEASSAGHAAEAARAHEASRERVGRLREQLREKESALEAAREHLAALRLARAKSEREAALLQEREAAGRRQVVQAEEELAAAGGERQELEAELAGMETLRSELETREARAGAAMEPVEADRRRALSELRVLQSQLERASGEQQGLARRRSELQERLNAATRESRRAVGLRAESEGGDREATARLAKLEEQVAAARGEVDRLRAELAEVEARRREAQGQLRATGEQLEAARRREREAWERESELRNRLSLLRSLKEEHRGMPAGAKALLEARLPGIVGTMASMIRVPRGYVTAVAAALGGAQGYVVARGFQEGLEALSFLSTHAGRATIAPLRLEGGETVPAPAEPLHPWLEGLLEGITFHGVAADLVSSEPRARELCARYLGLSLVVQDMPDAVELYRRLAGRLGGRVPFQVVTLDGRLLRARGDLASGPNGEKEGSLLAREAELASLVEEAERARARLEEARAAVAALESARTDLSRASSADAAAASALQGRIGKQTAACAELASQVAKAEAAIEWHRSRAAGAEREAAQGQEAVARGERELAESVARESEARARAEQLREDLSDRQSTVAEVEARLSRLRSQASAVQGRLRELEARVSAVSESLRRAEARVKRQEERLSQARQALEQLLRTPRAAAAAPSAVDLEAAEGLAAEASARAARTRAELATAESELTSLSRAREQAREEFSDARTRAERAAAELASLLREAAREATPRTEDSRPRTEDIEDFVGRAACPPPPGRGPLVPDELGTAGRQGTSHLPYRSDGGADGSAVDWPDAPLSTQHSALSTSMEAVERLGELLAEAPLDRFPSTWEAAAEKAESLRRELLSLGTVNAEAPEEYRLVSERHAFLTTQMDDLRRAERTLRRAIEDLEQVMEARFREVFGLVNAEFGRCFATLFGGGSASLILTEPERPLEGGVEVVAALPGKKGGSLLGLSGGERALTAVAFLFALMKVSPSPFCLLDEVDAALDESNVQRFCAMIRDLIRHTQFLVITHNRATMETAEALHGVSMAPDGTSRVVSLRLATKENQA